MTVDAHAEEGGTLRTRALKSSVLLGLQTGGSQVIRLVGNLILTRLLVPEAFGLVALIQLLMQGVVMLTDIGVQDSVVRAERDDADFLNTAWTIRVVRGVMIWLGTCAIAYPYAMFYEQPQLIQLVPVAGFHIVLMSLESTKELELNRKLLLQRLVPLEITSQVIGLIATIAFSYWLRSVWALIWGVLVSALVRTSMTHLTLPGVRNRFRIEQQAREEIVTYGRWIIVSSTLTFGASSLDRLVLGKLVPIDLLGIFGIAKTLASAPAQLTQVIGARVVFPAYSAIISRGDPLAPAFDRTRYPFLVGAGLLLAGLSACAQPVVDILYDERYVQAGPMLRLLPFGIWFQTVAATNTAAIKALGQPRVLAMASAAQVITLAIGLVPATLSVGIEGGILVLVGSGLMNCIVSTIWLARRDLCTWHGAVPTTALTLLSGLVGYQVEANLDLPPFPRLLVAALATSVFWAWPLRNLLGRLRTARGK